MSLAGSSQSGEQKKSESRGALQSWVFGSSACCHTLRLTGLKALGIASDIGKTLCQVWRSGGGRLRQQPKEELHCQLWRFIPCSDMSGSQNWGPLKWLVSV